MHNYHDFENFNRNDYNRIIIVFIYCVVLFNFVFFLYSHIVLKCGNICYIGNDIDISFLFFFLMKWITCVNMLSSFYDRKKIDVSVYFGQTLIGNHQIIIAWENLLNFEQIIFSYLRINLIFFSILVFSFYEYTKIALKLFIPPSKIKRWCNV